MALDLDAIIDDVVARPSEQLRTSLYKASRRDPAIEAEAQPLARERLAPIDTVIDNLDTVRRDKKLSRYDADEMRRKYPSTAKFLEDEDKAAIAFDDIDYLQQIEEESRRPNAISNMLRGFAGRTNIMGGNLIEFAGEFIEAGGDLLESGVRAISPEAADWASGGEGAVSPADPLKGAGKYLSEGADEAFGYQPQFTWDELKGDITPSNLIGFIAEQGVRSVPDMIASMWTLPAYVASRTEEMAEQRVMNDEGDEVDAMDLVSSVLPALVSSAFERYGAKGVFDAAPAKSFGGALKETGKAATKEGATEFIQGGIEYAGTTLGTAKEFSYSEMFDEQLAGLVAGSGFGGGIRGVTSTIEATQNRKIAKASLQIAEAEADQAQLDKLISLAQEVKMGDTSPETMKEYLNGIDKDIYIPEQVIQDLAADGDIDLPQHALNQLDGTGTDVQLELGDVLSDKKFTEAVRDYIRMDVNGMNRVDVQGGGKENLRKLIEDAASLSDERTEAEEIYKDVTEQLVATGRMRKADAKYQSQIIPAFVATEAKNRGVPVKQIYEDLWGFTVRGPDFEPGQDQKVFEEEFSPNLEGIQITEDVVAEETGEVYSITRDAQKEFDMTKKRRGVVRKLRECLDA